MIAQPSRQVNCYFSVTRVGRASTIVRNVGIMDIHSHMIDEFAGALSLIGGANFATQNLDEGRRYISDASSHTLNPGFGRPVIDLKHWRFSLEHTDIDLVGLDCGTEFQIAKDYETRHYIFQFPIEGSCYLKIGRGHTIVAPGEMFVINPKQTAIKRWVGPCRQLMVRFERDALDRLLCFELNRDHREPIVFEQLIVDLESSASLRNLTTQIWQSMLVNVSLQEKRVGRSLERSLMTAFLAILRHNYSDELSFSGAPAAPYYVKRAEDFIRTHVRDIITIEELVEISGVSSRSLYYGFRRWRDTTPMSYLRNFRLSIAHEELKRARDNESNVTQVALGVGYDHLSRFSKDYKQRYGVSPSVTMLQMH
jgi:AraC-like DNA-binding protein